MLLDSNGDVYTYDFAGGRGGKKYIANEPTTFNKIYMHGYQLKNYPTHEP